VLAVVPDAAQALPLNFSNGAKLKESNGLFGEAGVKEVVGWGTISWKPMGAPGSIICHNVIAGDVWNPVGGGAGKGETQASAVFDCETNRCAAGAVANFVPEELPWLSELQLNGLAKTNTIRSHSEHVKMDLTCDGKSLSHFQGSYQPGAPAGENKGTSPAHPGFLEFDQPGTGGLEEVEFSGTELPVGTVKELGYAEQELIQAK
jgi:hypothetical protein